MKNRQHFGRASVFTCQVCDRRTRATNDDIDHLCPECWELAGLDNLVNDSGGGLEEVIEERNYLFNKAVKRGSNGEAIKQANQYLWPNIARQKNADHIDGYDRDDLGESPDY